MEDMRLDGICQNAFSRSKKHEPAKRYDASKTLEVRSQARAASVGDSSKGTAGPRKGVLQPPHSEQAFKDMLLGVDWEHVYERVRGQLEDLFEDEPAPHHDPAAAAWDEDRAHMGLRWATAERRSPALPFAGKSADSPTQTVLASGAPPSDRLQRRQGTSTQWHHIHKAKEMALFVSSTLAPLLDLPVHVFKWVSMS